MKLLVDLKLELDEVPEEYRDCEATLKQWVWTERKSDLLEAMTLMAFSDTTTNTSNNNSRSHNKEHSCTRCATTTTTTTSHTTSLPASNASSSSSQTRNSTSSSTTITTSSSSSPHRHDITQRLHLLDNISHVQRQYLQMEEKNVVFEGLLNSFLDLMDSEYGFIGEIKFEDNDERTMYLQTHATTSIAWNAETRDFYENNAPSGLKFYNLNSLFGKVMTNKEVVISNNPQDDSRACGIPKGHPPLNHFLGIPFFDQGCQSMVGMVGIANKPDGYSQQDVDFLEPFVVTCSNLIQAYNAIQVNKELIDNLESRVKERTRELEFANARLEAANKQVLAASAAQLTHFACMSHEIRTPLNCIIGMSSLLEETELTDDQKESLRMVITSGELLCTVVNDILDYSKLQSGNVPIEIRRTKLLDTLYSVVKAFGHKARSKALGFKTMYSPLVPEYIHTDNNRLQQILYNLLGNAIKFSEEGGSVELDVDVVHYHQVNDNAEENNSYQAPATSSSSPPPAPAPPPKATTTPPLSSYQPITIEQQAASASPLPSSSRCPFHRTETAGTAASTDTTTTTTSSSFSGDESSSPSSFHPPSSSLDSNASSSSSSSCPFSRSKPAQQVQVAPASTSSTLPNLSAEEGGAGGACSISASSYLRFTVKDYGRGIDPKDFESIFEPFGQASYDTERLYGGTGLGLAITAKLVERLGGTIRVESELGRWSKFVVQLPVGGGGGVHGSGSGSTSSSYSSFASASASQPQHEHSRHLKKDSMILFVDKSQNVYDLHHHRVIYNLELPVERFNSCRDMYDWLLEQRKKEKHDDNCETKPTTRKNKRRFHFCLVHEDVYSHDVYQKLTSSFPHSALITFGPVTKPTNTHAHVRSISELNPCVFLESLAAVRNRVQSKNMVVVPGQQPQQQRLDDVSSFPFHQVRVLIAEDNVINQKVLLKILERLGVRGIDIANNGQEAVDMATKKQYDVVFMDMQMPIMCGDEACRIICDHYNNSNNNGNYSNWHVDGDDDDDNNQSHHHDQNNDHHPHCHSQQPPRRQPRQQQLRRPKIVFVTAHVSSAFEKHALASGGDGFMSKPFNIKKFEDYIRTLELGW